MAERLTKKISKTIQNKYSLGSCLYYDFAEIDDTNKLLNKLGKLEDILEKYDIESVEELDRRIAELEQELAELKEKDNYHLRYELAGADETITNLKQQLEEKDKEIEKIKTKQKPIVMHSKENYYFLEEENIKLHFAQKQLAITELEKVHAMLVSKAREVVGTGVVAVRLYTINEVIDQQIKELKGE